MAVAVLGEALVPVVMEKMRWQDRVEPRFPERHLMENLHGTILREVQWARLQLRDEKVEAEQPFEGIANSKVALGQANPEWVADSQREIEQLQAALGGESIVHHIGSTAVLNLSAKPILDFAVEVPSRELAENFDRVSAILYASGYRYVGLRGGLFFEKGPLPTRTHAVQVHPAGSPILSMLLSFRDSLTRNDQLRRDYEVTKRALARLLPRHRWTYAICKGHWIQEQQWRDLGAPSWVDWLISHQRAKRHLTQLVGRRIR